MQTRLDALEESIDVIDSMEEFPLLTDANILAREHAKMEHATISLNIARRLAQRSKER